MAKALPEPPPQRFKMQSLVAIVNGFWLLNIVAKLSIFDVSGRPSFAFKTYYNQRIQCFPDP